MPELVSLSSFVPSELILKAEGDWQYRGEPLSHQGVKDLFYRSVEWDDEVTTYVLKSGPTSIVLNYEDAPYFVADLEVDRDGKLRALLLGGRTSALVSDVLITEGSNYLYVLLSGNHRARLTRQCHQRTVGLALDESTVLLSQLRIPVIEKV